MTNIEFYIIRQQKKTHTTINYINEVEKKRKTEEFANKYK